MKTRINWRDFAGNIINDEELIYPEVQTDHPLMKWITEIIFLNGMTDEERDVVRQYFEKTGANLPMRTCYKISKGGKPNMEELEEMLFTGLMTDVSYENYLEMKERKPGISAREYWENICLYNEKDPAVKKLAKIFAVILDMSETSEEHLPHISRQEFERMKHDVEWVKKNLKAIEKSIMLWDK